MSLGATGISDCRTASSKDIPLGAILLDTGIGSMDAEICYCNTDLCVAQQCNGGFVILSAW